MANPERTPPAHPRLARHPRRIDGIRRASRPTVGLHLDGPEGDGGPDGTDADTFLRLGEAIELHRLLGAAIADAVGAQFGADGTRRMAAAVTSSQRTDAPARWRATFTGDGTTALETAEVGQAVDVLVAGVVVSRSETPGLGDAAGRVVVKVAPPQH